MVKLLRDADNRALTNVRFPMALVQRIRRPGMTWTLIALGVVIACSGIMLCIALIVSLHEDERQARIAWLNGLTSAMIGQTDQTIGVVDGVLLSVRSRVILDRSLDVRDPAMQAFLKGQTSGQAGVRGIGVFDEAGFPIYTSNSDVSDRISIADREFFKRQSKAPSDRLIVSEIVVNRFQHIPNVVASRSIIDSAGRWRGIVAASIDPAFLENFLGSLNLPAGGVLAIFNEDGSVLARRSALQDDKTRDYLTRVNLDDTAGSNFSEVLRDGLGLDGQSRYFIARKLSNYGLTATATVDLGTAMARWRKQAFTILSCSVAGSVAVGLLFAIVIFEIRRRGAANQLLASREASFRGLLSAIPDAVLGLKLNKSLEG